MNGRLSGKIAVITASTDGIGYAIARRLAQEGAKVIISSRKKENVDSAVARLNSEGLDATGVVCHVSNAEERKNLFETAKRLGGLDILISNAAINPASMTYVLDCEESKWDKIFEVNVKAAYLLAKEALPLLRLRPYGRIIFVSSAAAFFQLQAGLLGAYAVSKTALLGLTKAAAIQLAQKNITVNCIAPGIFQTKFANDYIQKSGGKKLVSAVTPMNRMGQLDEISGVAAFLASKDGSYVTGETVVVAGGAMSRL